MKLFVFVLVVVLVTLAIGVYFLYFSGSFEPEPSVVQPVDSQVGADVPSAGAAVGGDNKFGGPPRGAVPGVIGPPGPPPRTR